MRCSVRRTKCAVRRTLTFDEKTMKRLLAIILLISAAGCTSPSSPNKISSPINDDILDLAKYDLATSCPIHHVDLRIGYAPLAYGMPTGADSRFQETKAALFPYANDPVLYGCVAGPWKQARVKVCYQCQSAYQIWKRTKDLNTPK